MRKSIKYSWGCSIGPWKFGNFLFCSAYLKESELKNKFTNLYTAVYYPGLKTLFNFATFIFTLYIALFNLLLGLSGGRLWVINPVQKYITSQATLVSILL